MKHNGFILKAKQVVLDNLSDEHFGVKALANAMAVSRSELYKLVKKETRKSATQFIREIRLEKALELLKEHKHHIADISFMVGFGSPAYFTKRFKEYYGFLPSDAHLLHQYKPDQKLMVPKKASIFSNPSSLPIVLSIVVLSIVSAFAIWNYNSANTKNSIAVLPFDDLSPNQDQAFFSKGVSEAIIDRLTQNPEFAVIGKTSSFNFENKELMLEEIRKKLKVSYFLEGSVRKTGGYYQVTVQLIYTKNGLQIWSQKFDIESKDVLKAQEELADNVAEELEFVLF